MDLGTLEGKLRPFDCDALLRGLRNCGGLAFELLRSDIWRLEYGLRDFCWDMGQGTSRTDQGTSVSGLRDLDERTRRIRRADCVVSAAELRREDCGTSTCRLRRREDLGGFGGRTEHGTWLADLTTGQVGGHTTGLRSALLPRDFGRLDERIWEDSAGLGRGTSVGGLRDLDERTRRIRRADCVVSAAELRREDCGTSTCRLRRREDLGGFGGWTEHGTWLADLTTGQVGGHTTGLRSALLPRDFGRLDERIWEDSAGGPRDLGRRIA
ncbi:uncharacterized protein LOC124365504 [Homalodisca vitripennis]|uniref:uncharacterized protein LOC124365504 n=1 Tax=Homalodisca vitripennis TaxID=197043 RepID=UPI001EEA3372|nr:uncharacterized protein LOC124365504 [Homalodisca vitripennis]